MLVGQTGSPGLPRKELVDIVYYIKDTGIISLILQMDKLAILGWWYETMLDVDMAADPNQYIYEVMHETLT